MALVHHVGWDPRPCERSPWLWPLQAAASHFAEHHDWPTLADFDAVYRERTAGLDVAPLTFRANVRKQDKRVDGRIVLSALYDARISVAHEVPTRERDWHDFLNMLCFATFPHSKLALHARQYRCLTERVTDGCTRLPNRRTPEQDALTLFDEGGVVLATDDSSRLQLMAADDSAREGLCLALRDAGKLRVVPFGHALFEHEIEGLRCPGGATQVIVPDAALSDTPMMLRALDRALAAHIRDRSHFDSPRDAGQIRLATFAL
ncbi:MAG: DUF3025 domain-containing protein [Polyangiales bacterium]